MEARDTFPAFLLDGQHRDEGQPPGAGHAPLIISEAAGSIRSRGYRFTIDHVGLLRQSAMAVACVPPAMAPAVAAIHTAIRVGSRMARSPRPYATGSSSLMVARPSRRSIKPLAKASAPLPTSFFSTP